ncbi:hypothetical protein B5P45_09770 [Phyllobacterium zundukense]|uniref:ABC transmembrane type-1 domain-containing protein n=1 Tax=Phyllobacterium zundukense TaxID=1867719 RepID=A0A2N9W009_9HYPH|nr:hypothetical protein BLM14_22225 [Phyllobacterium zundukense]PIO45077.1 hypothetical protein B5P45_09770 [Phyllobacterium zundukense]
MRIRTLQRHRIVWHGLCGVGEPVPRYSARWVSVLVDASGSQGINWWSMAAIASAAILPLVLIGIFLERYIVKGLTAGAVK